MRGAVEALRAELELRERRPAGQRAREGEIRGKAQCEAHAAKRAAAAERAAQCAQQQ